jgi:glycosyltransferase involved in cell wall biosynthesis
VRRLNLNWKHAPDPSGYLYNNPVAADYLANYLDEVQPDLVHVTSCARLSASILSVIKEAGLPLILSLTDFWFLCPRINLLRSDDENCSGQTTPWECLRCQMRGTKIYRWSKKLLPAQTVPTMLKVVSQYPQLTRHRGLRGMATDMTDRKAYLRHSLSLADYRITASHFVRDIFVQNGITAPIKVQPYGHALSWLKRYKRKTPSEQFRLGFVGQISQAKGVHLLLEAAISLQEEFGDKFSLVIYGNLDKDPAYGDLLRELASKIRHIEFRGTYQREDSHKVYASFDAMVVPSLWYDFPLVIHEAFATQTPVIATNLGGMAEVVTPAVNGLLFERNNVDDLSQQLRRLITEPGLYETLQRGTPPAKTVDQEVDELEIIYQELTTQPLSKVSSTGLNLLVSYILFASLNAPIFRNKCEWFSLSQVEKFFT